MLPFPLPPRSSPNASPSPSPPRHLLPISTTIFPLPTPVIGSSNNRNILFSVGDGRRTLPATPSPLNSPVMEGRDASKMECEHYRRRCKIVAPCCNQVFPCHHCHNEATV